MTAVVGSYEEQAARAQAEADEQRAIHELARKKGNTPEQRAARQRVIATFFEWHLPAKTGEVPAYSERVDLGQPVYVVDANGVDQTKPPSRGVMGLGARPQYLLSEAVKSTGPGEPLYALCSTPAK